MSEGVNVSILGTRVVRTEDPALLTAGGTYADDLRVPELTWAARATFVRSPVAHASIGDIDVSAALAAPGIIAVLTARDMDDLPPPPPDDGGVAAKARRCRWAARGRSRCWPSTGCGT
jgi:carbon-monoxide dehydrogenase large subunit